MSTTSTQSLPNESTVHALLSSLFGKDVIVNPSENHVAAGNTAVLATFCDDEGKVERTISCNNEFANRVGAALTMFPAAGADEAIESQSVADKHLENLHEILNICVNLFSNTSGHLALGNVLSLTDVIEASLSECEKTSTVSFEVDIPRYGLGLFSLSAIE